MKSQLISDVFSLSQATIVAADLPLEMATYLEKEDDYLPWNVFLSRSRFYTDMLESTRIGSDLQKFLINLVRPIYTELTWTQDDSKHSWLKRFII